MKYLQALLIFSLFTISCNEKKDNGKKDINATAISIGSGQMPAITKDARNNLHLVYGYGDSIMYAYSNDKAITFSKPALISVFQTYAETKNDKYVKRHVFNT